MSDIINKLKERLSLEIKDTSCMNHKFNYVCIDCSIQQIENDFESLKKQLELEKYKNNNQFELLSYIEENCDDTYDWALENYKK